MTLYTLKEKNIRRTWFWLTTFLILVIGLGWLISYLADSYIILIIAIIYAILTSFLSYWFSDKIVLLMSRAQKISPENNKELYRIVENLCITAGLPLPKIYLINESSPNAFATGRNPKYAVIAVTKGLLEKLDRSELEGVIAHELSHIGNYDMLLSTVIVILTSIIAMLTDLFLRISFFGKRDRENQGAIIFLVYLVVALFASLAATLIRLAISRKREFLADASGALLTRYPEGLARALEKIASDPNPLKVASNATSHLYIVNPFKDKQSVNWFTRLFLTHPPIEERIRALREMGY